MIKDQLVMITFFDNFDLKISTLCAIHWISEILKIKHKTVFFAIFFGFFNEITLLLQCPKFEIQILNGL